MLNFFPFLFVFFWSSAFVSGQIIVQSASPFASLSFRFLIVAFGFIIFAKIFNEKIFVKKSLIYQSAVTGILFHGFYLGGVFYSSSLLPPFWQSVSALNPIFYMVNSFRSGFLGVSDVSVGPAFVILTLFGVVLFSVCLVLLNRGTGLRS